MDNERLGAFKIEYQVFDSMFLGAKNYVVNTVGKDKISIVAKIKGV